MDILKPRTIETFNQILAENQFIVLDFYASWCVPCKKATPELAKLAREFPHVKFVGVDVDQEGMQDVTAYFQVKSIPLFVVIANRETTLRLASFDAGTMDTIRRELLKFHPQ